MTKVFTAGAVEEAVLVHGLLEDAGITAVVHGEGLASVGPAGEYAFSPTIWILNDDDEMRAREIILQYQPTALTCPTCGYDLTGLPEPRCPECGEPFARRTRHPDWICSKCGEQIEGQFTDCWKCGTIRPEAETEQEQAE